jgi:type I restriction enzyme, S subunit
MSSKTLSIEDLLTSGDLLLVQDGNHGGNYPKASEFVSQGVPLITGACLVNGEVDYAQAGYISEERASALRVGFARAGDVLLTHKGTMGKTAIVPHSPHSVTVLNPQITLYRVNPAGKLDARYLKYYFDSEVFQKFLLQISSTSTISTLSIREQKKLCIPVPSIEEQKAISNTLGALDDRITLLRETNATLEAIAQALFKSWFVDFDPVRAKMEGRTPEGMDEATAALFPDAFEETELGLVPRGWSIKTMADVSTVGIGKTPPRKEHHWFSESPEDVRWVSIRDMGLVGTYASHTSEYLTNEAVEKFNVRRVPDNTVIMSFKMTIGRVAITDGEMTTNEAIAHFKLSDGVAVSTEYVYLHLKQFDFTKLSSTSSIADAVNSKTVREIPILVPDANVMTAFREQISAVFVMLKNSEQQTRTLSTLRDTMLPRLISGQLRLPEAQTATE